MEAACRGGSRHSSGGSRPGAVAAVPGTAEGAGIRGRGGQQPLEKGLWLGGPGVLAQEQGQGGALGGAGVSLPAVSNIQVPGTCMQHIIRCVKMC